MARKKQAGELNVQLTLSAKQFEASISKATASLNSNAAKMNRSLGTMEKGWKSASKAVASFQKLLIAGATLAAVGRVGKSVYDASVKVAILEKSFKNVLGSTAAATVQFDRLQAIVDQTGQNFFDLVPDYRRLLAASKDTNMEGANTEGIFRGIAMAAAALGLRADEAKGALYAVVQMINKGKVTAEELRRQMGERIPGAFKLAARAMGVTTQELDVMLDRGQLFTADFLPKFAKVLQEEFTGSVAAVVEASNKLSESWLRLKATAGDVLLPSIIMVQKAMTALFKIMDEGIKEPGYLETYIELFKAANQGLISPDEFQEAVWSKGEANETLTKIKEFYSAVETERIKFQTRFKAKSGKERAETLWKLREGIWRSAKEMAEIQKEASKLTDTWFDEENPGRIKPPERTKTDDPYAVQARGLQVLVDKINEEAEAAEKAREKTEDFRFAIEQIKELEIAVRITGGTGVSATAELGILLGQLHELEMTQRNMAEFGGIQDQWLAFDKGMKAANDRVKKVWIDGKEYVITQWTELENESNRIGERIGNNLGGALVDFVGGAKKAGEAFADFARSTLRWLAQLATQKVFSELFGSIFPTKAHTGGVIGQTSLPRRAVNPAVFAMAPRLHGGLLADEFPAILQKGEIVLPKGTRTGGSAPVEVVVNNYSGQPVKQSQQSSPGGGRRIMLDIGRDVAGGGPLARAIESRYALTPVAGRRA